MSERDDSQSTETDVFGDRRTLAVAGLVVVALIAVVSVGLMPSETASDPGSDADAGAVASPTPNEPATADGGGTGTPDESAPAVTMQVRSIESCGTRCRSVTVALSNDGDAPARDVRVRTQITADGSLIWEGQSDLGRLDANQTVTRTRTVEVGYVDAARIEANDGVVRIETTVRTASGTRTFTNRRDVS